MLALDRQDFGKAATLFKMVDDVPGMLGQASVLIQQRRRDDARGKLEEAHRKEPGRPGPMIALATLLAEGNEDEKCRASRLCEEAKGRGAGKRRSCPGLLRTGSPGAKVISAPREFLLEEAKERNPYGVHTATFAGLLVEMHRVDEAVDMLNERLAMNARDSAAYYQLYRALDARGEPPAALAALRAAFALAAGPGSDALAVALAYELEEQGCSAEAEQVLRTRLTGRDSANDDQLRLGLAWILLSRGERGRAPGQLKDAIAEASEVLSDPDPVPGTAKPIEIRKEALKCRGTAYLKLAEHRAEPGCTEPPRRTGPPRPGDLLRES